MRNSVRPRVGLRNICHVRPAQLAVGAALAAWGSLGCGAEDGDHGGALGEVPTYLAAIATQTADEYTTFTVTTPAIDGTIVQHFLKRGLETSGYISPSAYGHKVFIPNGADPSITKYSVRRNGQLSEEMTISFADEGVTFVDGAPFIGQTLISKDKAYLFDAANLRAILWDPEAMELKGESIDFADLLKEVVEDAPGYTPQIFTSPGFVKQVGDLMFVPVRWQNWSAETPDQILFPLGGLLVLDTKKNEVVHLLKDSRIIDTIYTVVSQEGDLYLFTGAYGASFNLAFDLGIPAGVLKIKKGEDEFDPDYYLNLEELTGGRPATTPTGGRGTDVYLKVLYEEEADLRDDDGKIKEEITLEPWSLIAKGWRLWRINVEDEEVIDVIEELPFGGTDGYFYAIPEEDRIFVAVLQGVKLGLSSMTLYEANGAEFTESISVPGTLQALTRLERGE